MHKLLSKLLNCLLLSLLFISAIPSNIIAEDSVGYSVDSSGNKTFYKNVTEAVNASMSKGVTIVMTCDWEFKSAMNVVEGKTIRIDMNGFAIKRVDSRSGTGHSGEVITMHPNSELYLTSSVSRDFSFKRVSSDDNPTEKITSGGLVTGGYTYNGGGIYMKKGAKLHLTNVAISGNQSWNTGGGIFVNGEDCEIHMDNAHIEYNYSRTSGGGIFSDADGTHIHMSNGSTISNNSANNKGSGGGIEFNYSWFSIEGDGTCHIANNLADNGNGGGIYVASRTFGSNNGTISGLDIHNNTANYGGGLYLDQNYTLVKDCKINYNGAHTDGGGVYNRGDNSYENVDIIGNKSNLIHTRNGTGNGGGIYCSANYDMWFSGNIQVHDNLNMNSPGGGTYIIDGEYFEYGSNGWEDQDVVLNGFASNGTYAYIYDDGLEETSLIGVKSGAIKNDKLLVKNLDSKAVKCFYPNYASNWRVEYVASDKQLWERNGGAAYKVYVDGKEYGAYYYDQFVSVTNSQNRILDHWDTGNFSTGNTTKNTLEFFMPARDVYIKGYYQDYLGMSNNIQIKYEESLAIGSEFRYLAYLNFTVGSESYWYSVPISWVYKDDNGNWADLPRGSKVEYNKVYAFKAVISPDLNKKILFAKNSDDYRTAITTNYTQSNSFSGRANSAVTDENGVMTVISSSVVTETRIYGVKQQVVYVNEGATVEEFKALLPKSATAYNNNNQSDTTTAEFLDIEQEYLDQILDENNLIKKNDNPFGKVMLKLPIKPRDGVKYEKYEINLAVYVIPKQEEAKAKITSIKELKIDVNVGTSKEDLLAQIPSYATGVDSDNKEWVLNVNKEGLESKLASIIDSNGKVLMPSESLVLELDASVMDGDKAQIDSDTKFKVTIDVTGSATGDASAILVAPFVDKTSGTYSESDFDGYGNLIITVTPNTEGEIVNYQVDNCDKQTGSTIKLSVGENTDKQYSVTIWTSKVGCDDSAKTTYTYVLKNTYSKLSTPTLNMISATYFNRVTFSPSIVYSDSSVTIKYQITKDGVKGDIKEASGGDTIVLDGEYSKSTVYEVELYASKRGYNDSSVKYYRYVIDNTNLQKEKVKTPSLDIPSGTYTRYDANSKLDSEGDLELKVSCATSGATIYYQVADQDPYELESDRNTITLAGTDDKAETFTLKLWAKKDGCDDSDVVTYNYTLDNTLKTLKTPSVDKPSGTYKGMELTINLSSDEDVTYKFQINNEEVLSNSTIELYGEENTSKTFIVKVWASKDNYKDSIVSTYTYTLDDTKDVKEIVSTPTLSLQSGTYTRYDGVNKLVDDNLAITVNCDTSDAKIFYQIGDDKPIELKDTNVITLSVEDGESKTYALKVWAEKDGFEKSAETTYSFVLDNTLKALKTPCVDKPSGTYNKEDLSNGNLVINLSSDEDVEFKYTVNGKESTGNTITLASDTNKVTTYEVKVWASKANYNDSPVVTYTYTLDNNEETRETVATPTLSAQSGTYTRYDEVNKLADGNLAITVKCDTSDATIYYQIDDNKDKVKLDSTKTINLSVEDGKSKTYTLKVWAEKDSIISDVVSYEFILDNTYRNLKAPSVDRTSGTYSKDQFSNNKLIINLSSAEDGVTYNYQIDNNGAITGSQIELEALSGASTTYKVTVWTSKTNYADSVKTTYTYTLNNALDSVESPTLDIPSGTYSIYGSDKKIDSNGNLNIKATCVEGATIHYQIDDGDIQTGNDIVLKGNGNTKVYHKLTVWASKKDYKDSSKTIYEYVIDNTLRACESPEVKLDPGTYTFDKDGTNEHFDTNGDLKVGVEANGSTIHYQIDGGELKTCDNSYTVSIASIKGLKQAHILTVWASKVGYSDSSKTNYTYVIDKTSLSVPTPTLSPDDTSTYAREDVDKYAYLSLDDDSGALQLKLTASAEKGSVYYKIKDVADSSEKWSDEISYNNEIILTAPYCEDKLYEVEVYAKDGDMVSSSNTYLYHLDNSEVYHTVLVNAYDALGNKLNFISTRKYLHGVDSTISAKTVYGYEFVGWKQKNSDELLTDQTISIDEVTTDMTLSAVYKKVINRMSLAISSIEADKQLPTDLSSIKVNNGFSSNIDITDYFDLDHKYWDTSDTVAKSNSAYTLVVPLKNDKKDEFLKLYTLNDGLSISGIKDSMVYLSQDKEYLNIIFPRTDEVSPDERKDLSYKILDVDSINDIEISYEEALRYYNANNWNLNKTVRMLLSNNNIEDDSFYYKSDITWNNFTIAFNPDNYDAQELVITGSYDVPSYISNKADINNNITLRIKVRAKLGYTPKEVINKVITCEEYMKSKDWTWSETKKACVYKVSNTSAD